MKKKKISLSRNAGYVRREICFSKQMSLFNFYFNINFCIPNNVNEGQ